RPHEFGGLLIRSLGEYMAGGEQHRCQFLGADRGASPSIDELIHDLSSNGGADCARQCTGCFDGISPTNPVGYGLDLLWRDQTDHGCDSVQELLHVTSP